MHTTRVAVTAFTLMSLLLICGAGSAGELDGRWQNGSWSDTKSGHVGPLRAKFCEQADGNYRVVFTGKYALVVPFRFKTTLNVVGRDGDKVIMAGESRIMGIVKFSYNAVADGNNFSSQYSSRRWNGEFNLSR